MVKSELVSAADAATLLGISRATLNRWAASGRIAVAVEMPGRTGARLFDRADVEALRVAASKAKATA